MWWTFDILVLWAMFHAFGTPPPLSVIWMCYFVGTLANLLPLPGGLGGVEGGMIGAFAAFGVSFDLAVLAVLSYRAISFWLPTIPGGIAYFQLRKTVAQWRSEEPSPSGVRARRRPARRARCRALRSGRRIGGTRGGVLRRPGDVLRRRFGVQVGMVFHAGSVGGALDRVAEPVTGPHVAFPVPVEAADQREQPHHRQNSMMLVDQTSG